MGGATPTGSTVNYHAFTLTTATMVSMDVGFDVPAHLRLFSRLPPGSDNGTELCRDTVAGLICESSYIDGDDSSRGGCVNTPMMQKVLLPGDYIMAVGSQSLSIQDAINGVNAQSTSILQYFLNILKNAVPLSNGSCV
ncbi:hypothetical protein MNBD_GAMMA11-2300 [hydrothermal vent metagenome]|uniref:Uncharacterized protein n=1 Tax=hydrothermal vent metagenome TaxID=652676 RepID=A0A3B0XDY5_9ZZZZ